jgi:oligopeptidase B
MVFAVAHVRGGGELGRGWYEHGKLLEKKNTFNDFVDCARRLVDTGWTSADRMVAHGGSAGYLAIHALTSINDTRVYYVEPAKWVVKSRVVV